MRFELALWLAAGQIAEPELRPTAARRAFSKIPVTLKRAGLNLRRLDVKLDRRTGDMQDVKVRVTGLEENYGQTRRWLDGMERDIAHIKQRVTLWKLYSPGSRAIQRAL